MIDELQTKHSNDVASDVREYISDVCKNILLNTSVFKKDDNGQKALNRFIATLEVN